MLNIQSRRSKRIKVYEFLTSLLLVLFPVKVFDSALTVLIDPVSKPSQVYVSIASLAFGLVIFRPIWKGSAFFPRMVILIIGGVLVPALLALLILALLAAPSGLMR